MNSLKIKKINKMWETWLLLLCDLKQQQFAWIDWQPKPGKQGTKGQKQILQENAKTLRFYVYCVLAVNVGLSFYFSLLQVTWFRGPLSTRKFFPFISWFVCLTILLKTLWTNVWEGRPLDKEQAITFCAFWSRSMNIISSLHIWLYLLYLQYVK